MTNNTDKYNNRSHIPIKQPYILFPSITLNINKAKGTNNICHIKKSNSNLTSLP